VDSARAETHVRLLAEDQLRRAMTSPRYRWLDEDFQAGGQPPVEVGLHRVSAVLSALRQVGVLSGATAGGLAAEFADALALRGLHDPRGLASPAPAGPGGATGAGAIAADAAAQPGGAPGGRYLAVPVGVVIPAEWDGHEGEVHVLAFVLAPDRAAITTSFVSSWREAPAAAGGTATPQPSFPPFGGSGVTDDQGRRYGLTLEIAGGGWHESGVLALSAVPPPGTRWLDMPVSPDRSVRIDLTGAPVVRARHEHHPPPPLGELLLGAVAETMLGGGQLVGMSATLLATGLAEVADALTAVRLLAPDSPAASHLAALCARRAIEVRGPWASRARASGLPPPWASVLSGSRRVDGPQGASTATAVLPEINGARFVLAGLSSWERHATVLVFAWGWSRRPREFRPQQPFSWWARDDADRWHVGRIAMHDAAPGTFQLELTPPLHPAARSLDIILTGRAGRITATLPLTWPGRLAEPQNQDISY
jgi:hypothetical protein